MKIPNYVKKAVHDKFDYGWSPALVDALLEYIERTWTRKKEGN